MQVEDHGHPAEVRTAGAVIVMAEGTVRCPIGGEKVDETAARVNAFLVVIVLTTAIVTGSPWLMGYLILDYLLKLLLGFACSPNCLIARVVVSALRLEKRPIDSAPKRFAALLALIMSTIALVMAYTFHSMFWFQAVASAFVVVASLDAVADFCLGCYLFGLLPERISAVIARR